MDQLPRLGKRERICLLSLLLVIMWFLFGEVSSSSGSWDGLRYFIVSHSEPSIQLLFNAHKVTIFSSSERKR